MMSRRIAILIQNAEFADPKISKIAPTPAQIGSLESVLSSPDAGNYEVSVIVNGDVQTLREQITKTFRGRDKDDAVLVIYAGHALQDQFGDLYLAATDTRLDMLDATGLPLGRLRDQLDRTQSKRNLIVLDCGTVAVYKGSASAVGSSSGMLQALEGNRRGRMVVVSSDLVDRAIDDGDPIGDEPAKSISSVLSSALLDGEADLNSDGQISGDELYEYIYRRSLSESPSGPMPRKFSSSDFVPFVVARNPVLQPADLPEELRAALSSPLAWMREGAIGELERLLSSEEKSISFAAHQALSELANDPTPQISVSATNALRAFPISESSVEPAPQPTPPPPSSPRPTIPIWGWIVGGVILLFTVGFVAGLAGVFKPKAKQVPLPTPTVSATSTQPAIAATAEDPPAVEPTPLPELSVPSSIGMVQIPGGTYPIAEDRAVDIGSYWIDRFEVTNLDFADYLAEAGLPMPSYWAENDIPNAFGDHPVRLVTWDQAQAYCDWLGKRLPTEAEWEVAGRGHDGLLYPWGEEASAVSLPTSSTYASGSIPANRSIFGIYDLAGNVWEWVGEPYLPVAEELHVLRGGANNFQNDLTYRLVGEPDVSSMINDSGFRCASDEAEVALDRELLLTDEFSDVLSGWYQAAEPVSDYFYGYHPTDFYHVQVSSPEGCLAVRHDSKLNDFVADVEIFKARVEEEGADYRHGLVIREQDGEFYAFTISPLSKQWQIIKNSLGGINILSEGSEESIRGQTRDERDRLTVIANGPELSLSVNGRLVSTVFDDGFRDGNLGFIVQTLDQPYAHIHFDRVFVWELPKSATVPEMPEASPAASRFDAPACGGSVTGDDLLQSFFTYTVKDGDTLSAIANLFGLSLADVKGANGRRIDDPNVISVGQVLIIPES